MSVIKNYIDGEKLVAAEQSEVFNNALGMALVSCKQFSYHHRRITSFWEKELCCYFLLSLIQLILFRSAQRKIFYIHKRLPQLAFRRYVGQLPDDKVVMINALFFQQSSNDLFHFRLFFQLFAAEADERNAHHCKKSFIVDTNKFSQRIGNGLQNCSSFSQIGSQRLIPQIALVSAHVRSE